MTDTLDDLAAAVERMERMAQELVNDCRLWRNELADKATPDPLAAYRKADGTVHWLQAYADELRVGDWVQRCHGDPDWHRVEDAADIGDRLCRITYDGTAHDWAPRDAIRVAACPS